MRGYLTEEPVIVGVETRTRAPVRLPRDPATLQHVAVCSLYPCGESAGYADSIVATAMDGQSVADACAAFMGVKD